MKKSEVSLLTSCLLAALLLGGCGGKAQERAADSDVKPPVTVRARPVVATWLGNPARTFYGSGPWAAGPLEISWKFKTRSISGRLHKDPWGGTSWPGQPSVNNDRVYFGSADGNVYCLSTKDGSLIWKFQGLDSMKATPTIVGDRILASGLDHYLYSLDAEDGSVVWKFKAGFEIDGSVAAIDGRLYFGCEDGYFYCLDAEDGSLVYKVGRLGSMEGSCSVHDGRIYVGTEQGDLFCLNQEDGKTIWKARIGAARSRPSSSRSR